VKISHNSTATNQNQTPNVGELGEKLVAEWLKNKGWTILHHRWRCRWGEIDLIALKMGEGESGEVSGERGAGSGGNSPLLRQLDPIIAFIEIKTRSRKNWDEDGLLAITPRKQAKIRQTAELFLANYPDSATVNCRFDVAIVKCERLSPSLRRAVASNVIQGTPVELGNPVQVAGYQLILQDYIDSAFE
jgi:putative endonuclease